MVNIKKYTPENHNLKFMIYGKSGAGKTTLASTAPKPLYICAENGLASIASKAPEYVEVNSLAELDAVYKELKKGLDYDTIIIDSISEIAEVIKEKLTNRGTKAMSMRERGTYADKMMQIIRDIISLPYHVGAIIHENVLTDDDGNIKIIDIAIQGSARSNIPRYFDVVAYAYLDGDAHKATAKPRDTLLTKDRLNCLPDNLPLDVTEWIEAFKNSVKVAKQKVVKTIKVDDLADAKDAIDKMGKGQEDIFIKRIQDSKNFNDEQKEKLIEYINEKAQ